MALNAYSVPNVPIKQYQYIRIGYLGQQNIEKLPLIVTGVNFSYKIKEEYTYKSYVLRRYKATPYKSYIELGKYPLDLIYSDVVGPIYPIGFNSARYFITQRNDDTKFIDVNIIKTKGEAFKSFKRFKARRERSNRKIYRLRSNNSSKYKKGIFSNFLTKEGIIYKPTVPRNPQ